MSEGNGKLELGKLSGMISGLLTGQTSLFNKADQLKDGISEIEKKQTLFRAEIDEAQKDINGLGKKITGIEEKVGAKMKAQRNLIITILGLVIAFLTLWVYILRPDMVILKKSQQHQYSPTIGNEKR